MKARLGAVLFGIGVFAVVIAAGLAFYVAPTVARLPYDLKPCTETVTEDCLRTSVAEAQDAQFLYTAAGDPPIVKIETGTLRSTTTISPLPDTTESEMKGDLDGEAVVWQAYGNTAWVEEDSTSISKYEAKLALDRDTAAAAAWGGQVLVDVAPPAQPAPVTFSGQLYKFPFGTEQKDYTYFDRDLRQALPIRYQDTEQIQGLEVYRFEQVIPETELTFAADRITALLNTFAPTATTGKVTYSNTRTIWVEPVTGQFIKVSEQQRKTLTPDAGAPTQLLNGDFVYTEDTVTNNVASTGDTKSQIELISRWLPIGLAVLGAILLVLGLWMVTTGRRAAAAARHRHEDINASSDEDGKVTA